MNIKKELKNNCRFQNEIDLIKKLGGKIIKIERKSLKSN